MATEPEPQAELAPRKQAPPAAPAKSSRLRIFIILIFSFLLMIAIAAAAYGFAARSWQDSLRAQIERGLTEKAKMFAAEVDSGHARSIGTLTSQVAQNAGARATIIDMNGKVIADSEVRLSALEDEGRSPEFVAALRGDTGLDVRSRSAFGVPVLYVAVPVPGGAVRLAYPLADVEIASAHARHSLVLGCALAAIAALIIALFVSALIARPSAVPQLPE